MQVYKMEYHLKTCCFSWSPVLSYGFNSTVTPGYSRREFETSADQILMVILSQIKPPAPWTLDQTLQMKRKMDEERYEQDSMVPRSVGIFIISSKVANNVIISSSPCAIQQQNFFNLIKLLFTKFCNYSLM